ncbi:hypothetical protein CANINC_001206 [Pichia inconspicua]|uniref:Sigma-54 factor interaction domain-containing protein n=1 Tax=Pichia inconspicua TaxID=52247 RepID=A0A4T0X478_9ASCO|nr:hypothetical protein CANINC_001206 [[Candida] inconspicua]
MTQIEQLAEELISCANVTDQRVVVLIYGPPGSGKSTVAEKLVELINRNTIDVPAINCSTSKPFKVYTGFGGTQTQICEYRNEPISNENKIPAAIHLKMDGFHLPLAKLTNELITRRGCHESFDSKLVVRLCELLANNEWSSLSIPDFDHQKKDPVNPGIRLNAASKIVVFEGLYLMLDVPPWNDIPKMVSELKGDKYPIKVVKINGGDTNELAERVAKRHYNCGLVKSYEEGLERYYANDIHNANLVISNSIESLTDYVVDNTKHI